MGYLDTVSLLPTVVCPRPCFKQKIHIPGVTLNLYTHGKRFSSESLPSAQEWNDTSTNRVPLPK